eukprot:15446937-Alexandrium_andersonii.AAC.1
MVAQQAVQEKCQAPRLHALRSEKRSFCRAQHFRGQVAEPGQGLARVRAVVLLVEGHQLGQEGFDRDYVGFLRAAHVSPPDLGQKERPDHMPAPHVDAAEVEPVQHVQDDNTRCCHPERL